MRPKLSASSSESVSISGDANRRYSAVRQRFRRPCSIAPVMNRHMWPSLQPIAIWITRSSIFSVMLAAPGPVPRDIAGPDGTTLMHAAAQFNRAHALPWYQDAKVDLNEFVLDGRTLPHDAAFTGALGSVALLLDAGLDPDSRDKDGVSARDYFLLRGDGATPGLHPGAASTAARLGAQ